MRRSRRKISRARTSGWWTRVRSPVPWPQLCCRPTGGRARGLDGDAIVRRVLELQSRQVTYFLVDTLEYLQKGGRIGGARALVGGVLQVKPILTLREGRVEFFEQQRTKTRALARIRELVVLACPRSRESFLCVMHADARGEAQDLASGLGSALGLEEIPIYELPPAIVAHGGPGILATSYFSASLRQERPVLAR